MKNPKQEVPLLELFEKKFGIRKNGLCGSRATSLLSKYCYFMTNFNFPIYDSLVLRHYKKLAFHFSLKDMRFYKQPKFITFLDSMKYLNKEVNDFNKLDNLLWLYGKIEDDSFSLILKKHQFLELVELKRKPDEKVYKNLDRYESLFDSYQLELIQLVSMVETQIKPFKIQN